MNIFVLSENPVEAAKWALDKHVVKMPTESAQLLANCFPKERLAKPDCPRTAMGQARKHSHFNHPCAKWVRESRGNMLWLISYAIALDNERMRRFNPVRSKSIEFIIWAANHINDSLVPEGELTKFVQAMPEQYKNDNPVTGYRNYYKFGKKHLHSWKRNKPNWIQ